MSTGLTKPVITLANIDPQSDMWAVFDDDVSDGGFGDDADLENAGMPHDPSTSAPHADSKVQSQGHQRVMSTEDPHRWSPQYDHVAAAQAVRTVDLADTPSSPTPAHAAHVGGEGEGDELDPPRPGWMDSVRKKRGFSRGSARTSSSSSANRTALTGLLESMGIHSMGQPGSGRTSRNSMKSEDARPVMGQNVQSPAGKGRRKGSRSGSTSISGPSAGSQGQMQAHAAGGAEGRFRLKLPQLQGVDVEDGQWYVDLPLRRSIVIWRSLRHYLTAQVLLATPERARPLHFRSDDPHIRPALIPHAQRDKAPSARPHRFPPAVRGKRRNSRVFRWLIYRKRSFNRDGRQQA